MLSRMLGGALPFSLGDCITEMLAVVVFALWNIGISVENPGPKNILIQSCFWCQMQHF